MLSVAQLDQRKSLSVRSQSPYHLLSWDEKVGLNIQILRRRRSWELSDLATRLFVSQSTISRWERGERSIKGEMLGKIADVFEVEAKDLLP